MYHAVHLISESCDHDTMLIKAETPDELVSEIQKRCIEELAYISEFFVESEDTNKSRKFQTALGNAISAAWESRDSEEFGDEEE
jgi:hypothetical protein